MNTNENAAEWVELERLHGWDKNPKKHPDAQMRDLMKSIKRFGWGAVILARPNGEIIAGHGRMEAAKRLGMAKVPVRFLDLDPAEAHLLALADNKLTEVGEWDDAMLREILASAKGDGADLDGLGWSDEELLALLANDPSGSSDSGDDEAGAADLVDRAEELQRKWSVKPGDLWACGEHLVICGDCRDPDVLARLFADERCAIAVTSPPYASQRKYDESSGFKPIHPDEFVEWFDAVQRGVRAHLADDGSWFVNIKEHCEDGQRHLYVNDLVAAHVRRWGWRYIDGLIWTHEGTPKSVHRRFKNGWEPVFHFAPAREFKFRPERVRYESDAVPGKYAEKKRDRIDMAAAQGHTGDIFANPELGHGLAFPSNVLKLGKNRESWGHGAAFPVELPEFFVKAYTDPGDIVFEPFTGSGTTLIAAHQNGRRGFGSEISPKYVAVTLERLAQLGAEPELTATAPRRFSAP
jgi:DNA modification methylase